MKKLLLLVFFAIVLNSCNGGYEVPQEIITRDSIHKKFPESAINPTNPRYSVEKVGKCENCKNDIYISVLTFEGKKILLLEGYSSNTAIPLD